MFIGATTVSCKKKGCTDITANNYDSKAKKDDGSCTYDPVVAVTPPMSINSDPTYSFLLDDVLNEHPGASGMVSGVNGTSSSIGPVTTTASWDFGYYDDATSTSVIDVEKGIKVYATGSMTDTEYSNYFTIGTYSYATSGGSGISMYVQDASTGDIYRTNLGGQTGSAFKIVDKLDVYLGGVLCVKTYLQFNCKLYNENNLSDIRTITEGEMICHYTDL